MIFFDTNLYLYSVAFDCMNRKPGIQIRYKIIRPRKSTIFVFKIQDSNQFFPISRGKHVNVTFLASVDLILVVLLTADGVELEIVDGRASRLHGSGGPASRLNDNVGENRLNVREGRQAANADEATLLSGGGGRRPVVGRVGILRLAEDPSRRLMGRLRACFGRTNTRVKTIDYRCDDEKKLLSWGDILVSMRS